jgi:hypothetical protein
MNKLKMFAVGLGVIALVQSSVAERYSFVGHRAQGMGGANAASVNDGSAQWHNPAAFGFFMRQPDPVQGSVTNSITNTTVVVDYVAVTNYVAEVDSVDTNALVETESAGTNVVAADDALVDTNAVVESETGDTNAVPAVQSTDDLLAAMDSANSSTNFTVEYVAVTNEQLDVAQEIVPAEVIPERARADNANLQKNVFGWNLFGLGVGYTMTDEMPEYVTQIGLIDFEAFDGGGLVATVEGVESMLAMGSTLYGLGSNPDNAFYVDVNAGMNFRIGHVGVGIRSFGEVAGFVDSLDTVNLGIQQTEAEFITAINDAASLDGFIPGSWIYQSIMPGDLNISTNTGGADAEAYIDYQLTQMRGDGSMNQQMVNDSVFMVNQITYSQDPNNPASTSIENNTSTVTARGFGLFEVPVSYGYAFNDNLSIGITAKGMYGTVTGTKVRFNDGDALDNAMDLLEENTEASFNFGLDLGVLYRMKMLQFAAVAHNINAPKFDGFTDTIEIRNDAGILVDTVPVVIPDYTIDPQVTLGAAFIPSERLVLEMSYELLETGTLLDNYDIQRIAFGGELDLWLLALRLGAYNNLAADWQDWVATGGVGLNLWAVRLDVGGAYSIGENAEYEGSEIPEEARLYAAISIEF